MFGWCLGDVWAHFWAYFEVFSAVKSAFLARRSAKNCENGYKMGVLGYCLWAIFQKMGDFFIFQRAFRENGWELELELWRGGKDGVLRDFGTPKILKNLFNFFLGAKK